MLETLVMGVVGMEESELDGVLVAVRVGPRN